MQEKIDCGVFVCCYAYGMFKLKHGNINFRKLDTTSSFKRSYGVEYLIQENSNGFNFNILCIKHWREDIRNLIGFLIDDFRNTFSVKSYDDFLVEQDQLRRDFSRNRIKRGRIGKDKISNKKKLSKETKRNDYVPPIIEINVDKYGKGTVNVSNEE